MKILYVANGGFGDASWSTSWPRIFSEMGHQIDVFLMEFTGNPYHANPYIGKMFREGYMTSSKIIRSVIEENSYDFVLIPNNACGGVKEVIEATNGLENIHLFRGTSGTQIVSGLEVPPLTKPEWYYTEEEFKFIEDSNLMNSILFHPLSSSVTEPSRNINFNVVIECAKKLDNVVVVYGGRRFLPLDDLRRMEKAGVRLLWEDYNCFNDKSGTPLGKFFAIASQCRAGVHGWSGSFTLSMGYNKPYVMVAPGEGIRANSAEPYVDTKLLYEQGMDRARRYGCLNHSIWAITDKAEAIVGSVNHVLAGNTGTYNKEWQFIKE